MPQNLAPASSRSLGHLSSSDSGVGEAREHRFLDRQRRHERQARGGGSLGRQVDHGRAHEVARRVEPARPCRPRPAVWRSATSQVPSGTCSPAASRASRSALVEPVSATVSIRTGNSGGGEQQPAAPFAKCPSQPVSRIAERAHQHGAHDQQRPVRPLALALHRCRRARRRTSA